MSILNWFTAGFGLATGGLILYLVRRDHLHTRHGLWWLPLALVIAVLGAFPRLADWIGGMLGVYYPPIIPLIVGFIVLVVKILAMDIQQSKLEIKLNRLIQRLAMLEGNLEPRPGEESAGNKTDFT